jgi:uncharacterized delta-60 repeat protein
MSLFRRKYLFVFILSILNGICLGQFIINDTSFNSFNQSCNNGSGFSHGVNSVSIMPNGKIFTTGNYRNYNGKNTSYISVLDSNLILDSSFSIKNVDGIFDIRTVSVQSSGKIIAGGNIYNYDENHPMNIVRLDSSGMFDSTFLSGLGFDNIVNKTLIQPDNKILVGGTFTTYNGNSHNKIVRLNEDGTLDTFFSIGQGFDQQVTDIKIQPDGKILCGGSFSNYQNTSFNRLNRLNIDGSIDGNFNINQGFDNQVNTVAVQSDGKILVGGSFNSFDGVSSNKIIRLNDDGSIDNTFQIGIGFDSIVEKIEIQQDGKILVGGRFSFYNSNSANRIIRLNSDGSIDTSFYIGNGFDNLVKDIKIQSNGKIIAVGSFNFFDYDVYGKIIRIEINGSQDSTINNNQSEFNHTVYSTTLQNDGKIIVGGAFTRYNSSRNRRIVRIYDNGEIDSTFNTVNGFNNAVLKTLIQPDGKILVCGGFTNFNGISRKGIARINQDGSLDTSFNIGNGFDNGAFTMALQTDGKILVGGWFTEYNGFSSNRIIRLNQDGSIDPSFIVGSGFNNVVYSIALQNNGKVIVGGAFQSYDGTLYNCLIRLNDDGLIDNNFNIGNGFNGAVSHVKILDASKILVAGNFNFYNGNVRQGLVKLNSNGSLDLTFGNNTGITNVFPVSVAVWDSQLQTDGKIILCGEFNEYQGNPRERILRINANGSIDTTFIPPINGFKNTVRTISLIDSNNIIAGGDFTSFDGKCNNRIVKIVEFCKPIVDSVFKNVCLGSNYTYLDGTVSNNLLSNESYTSIFSNSSSYGCDSSVVESIQVISSIDTSIFRVSNTLTANQENVSYQWYNCDFGFLPVNYATSQSFTTSVEGNYAVVITAGDCKDTSSCYSISGLSINENNLLNEFYAYPNPTNGEVKILFQNEVFSPYLCTVYTLEGRVVFQKLIQSNSDNTIDLSNLNNGVYIFKINLKDLSYFQKVVKN